MIQKNDLRIGNLIMDEHGIFSYVYQIYNTGVELASDMNGHDDIDARFDEIFGIPITEKILMKCGLDYDGIYYTRCEDSFSFGLINGKCFLSISEITFDDDFKYLHQLQNLYFSLTQTELTINL